MKTEEPERMGCVCAEGEQRRSESKQSNKKKLKRDEMDER
jgi:hypothetical protein